MTPLNGTRPDHERLVTLAQSLLSSGANGLVVLGTTGEGPSFSLEERMDIMSALAEARLPTDRVLVGTGAAAITDSIGLSRHAAALGFAGILLLPPFYYKAIDEEGILAFVRGVVNSLSDEPIPIYLYNFPALSGILFTISIVEKLVAEFGDCIAGVKDSSRDSAYLRSIIRLSSSLDVFAVSEIDIPAARSGELAGVILGTANIHLSDCLRAYGDGSKEALSRVKAISRIFDGMPEIPAIKHLLSEIYGTPSLAEVRPPLTTLTAAQASTLLRRFQAVYNGNALGRPGY